ncbi:MAG: FAD-dependent oxidoreductase [Nitrospirales bacterium]|nr:FAD-dependent oxidoreductase [Nitrospirales bacterium]
MEKFDIIIIGAGISGMSLAHYAAKAGLRTAVIEKGEKVGGTLCSPKIASDFWVELGAHTCYNSYGNLIGIIEDCGIKGMLIPREKVGFKMLVDTKIKTIPSQLNFIELMFSGPRIFFLKKSGESLRSYYGRIVGKGNYDKVFGPAFNAVLSQKADDFPADMLFNKRPRRQDILKSFTLTEGLQAVPGAIAAQKGITVITGKEVSALTANGSSFTLTTTDGIELTTPYCCLATPPNIAAGIVAKPSEPAIFSVRRFNSFSSGQCCSLANFKYGSKLPIWRRSLGSQAELVIRVGCGLVPRLWHSHTSRPSQH